MNELTQQENITLMLRFSALSPWLQFRHFPSNGFRHGYCTGTPPGKSIRLMAITMQAMQWQMNPYAVAQKLSL